MNWYKNKMFDNSRYSVVNVNDSKMSEDEMKERGCVFMPYDLAQQHDEESSKQYNEFMEEYDKQCECCPKCGATEHTQTLSGFILNLDRKDEYKDLNRCGCIKCGDKHSKHNRIPRYETFYF